ncbi:hypothetical protein [Halomonas sp. JS92-SW72]|uniref:MmyB family transcriptional regulator n=1 Tax=Halomonas sp. JS92-SW72 TaxID=2306583 RepID=UPI001F09C7E2|nr:hypothetical protein [Halomonas sp. JS92-SW72]
MMRLLFAAPSLRRRLPEWRQDAARLLAQFRCDLAAAPEDPAMQELIEALDELSLDFRRWWEQPNHDAYRYGIGISGWWFISPPTDRAPNRRESGRCECAFSPPPRGSQKAYPRAPPSAARLPLSAARPTKTSPLDAGWSLSVYSHFR